MEKLIDKVVLIVGATGGIGAAAAKQLHRSGARVYITSRSVEKLNNLTNDLGLPEERSFILDFDKEVTISSAVETILAKESKIDILINAAGVGIIKNFEQLTVEDMRKSMQVNLFGPFALLQAILPSMKEQKKGLIINIPGVLGRTPMAGATAYSASKFGLNGMMKSLREELKRTEIRITQLYLGGVDSPFWDTIDLRVQRDKMIIAEEAGKAIWFLCQQPSNAVVSEMVIQPFNHQAI
ncbi:MAG TPA: SDR family oxidoreductase [Bacteroidia bacterium]|nr:SDR family oxidoreductase [Bacteroidia bacterium]